MTRYFFLRQDLFDTLDMIDVQGHTDETARYNWITGVRFPRPVPVQTLLLDPEYGLDSPDILDTTIPLMSDRLLQALYSAGVDNLDVYPMILQHPENGGRWDHYKAVNVVGCIDAIDMDRSEHTPTASGLGSYFTSISLMEDVIRDALCFRLRTGPGFIVVHQRVAAAISGLGLKAVLLQPIDEYDGD